MFESRPYDDDFEVREIAQFGLVRNGSDRLKSVDIKPVHPFERDELGRLNDPPRREALASGLPLIVFGQRAVVLAPAPSRATDQPRRLSVAGRRGLVDTGGHLA